MSREIFGPKKFQVEKKIIEKIARKEEKGIKEMPPKAVEKELSAEERRALREKMEKETMEFLKPVSEDIKGKEAAKIIERWRKYAAQEKAIEKGKEHLLTEEEILKREAEEKFKVKKTRTWFRHERRGHRRGLKPKKKWHRESKLKEKARDSGL